MRFYGWLVFDFVINIWFFLIDKFIRFLGMILLVYKVNNERNFVLVIVVYIYGKVNYLKRSVLNFVELYN